MIHTWDSVLIRQVEHHRVFYRLTDTHIIVFAILHESQLPIRHLSQRKRID